MSNTILPLKLILEGDHRSLITALREVAQADPHTASQRVELTFEQLKKDIIKAEPNTSEDKLSQQHTLLQHYLLNNHEGLNIYHTETPFPIFLSDQILTSLMVNYKHHSDLQHLVYRFTLLLTLALAKKVDAITNLQDPLQKFIELSVQLIGTWEPSTGRSGKEFPEFLQHFIDTFSTLEIASNETWQNLFLQLDAFKKAYEVRTQKLEQRLQESASVNPDIAKHQHTVNRWINRKLNNKHLPDDFISFINQHLVGDLQFLLIQQGEVSETWKNWQKLLHLLSWIYTPETDEAFTKKRNAALYQSITELDERHLQHMPFPKKYEDFINQLSESFMELIKGNTVETKIYTASEESMANVVIKQSVIKNHEIYNEGDWYLFTLDNNTSLRAKLIHKNTETDILVFSNYLGKKVYESSFEKFSMLLATQSCQPIKLVNIFKTALFTALKSLEILHRKNLKEKQRSITQLQKSREQAAEKARLESEKIEQQKAQEVIDREAHIKRRSEIQPEVLQLYGEKLKTLCVGAWVSIKQPNGEAQKCKLSVKLASTNRFIFTDRLGQPTVEKSLDELIDLMINSELDIISQGENFDNKLEKIVKNLRK